MRIEVFYHFAFAVCQLLHATKSVVSSSDHRKWFYVLKIVLKITELLKNIEYIQGFMIFMKVMGGTRDGKHEWYCVDSFTQ